MPMQPDLARVSLGELLDRIRKEMVPLTGPFSYYSAALSEEDRRDYLEDPIAALPPALVRQLPPVTILLLPYLDNNGTKNGAGMGAVVTVERPSDTRYLRSTAWMEGDQLVAAFAVEELEVGDYHYELYHHLARAVGQHMTADKMAEYDAELRDELANRTHGEVDEESWRAKQSILQKPGSAKRETKAFRDYSRLSFIDTLTLFLHGICCDIDVETGPRQLPSRFLRKRLKILQGMFPLPTGYALFPEDLDQTKPEKDRSPNPVAEAERSSSAI